MTRPFCTSPRDLPRLFLAAAFAALLPIVGASCGGKVEVATGPAFDPCYDAKTEEDCGGDCHWEWGIQEGTCGQPEALGCFGPASQCMSDSDCRVEQTCEEREVAPCPPRQWRLPCDLHQSSVVLLAARARRALIAPWSPARPAIVFSMPLGSDDA